MIYSGTRNISFAFYFWPSEWRLGNVQHPTVIHALVPDISSENYQIGFWVWESMPVTLSRGTVSHIDDVPNSDALANVQVKEVIRSQSSRASRSTIDHDFVCLHTDCAMCCSGWRRGARGYVKMMVLSTFFQKREVRSRVYVLSVMENWPVFPVAPPNKHTLFSA